MSLAFASDGDAANIAAVNAILATGAVPPAAAPAVECCTTLSFLRSILPPSGLYVAGRKTSGGFRNAVCASIEELTQSVLSYSAQGVDSYMALAAYREPFVMGVKNGEPIKQIRVHRNVRALRCFFTDLDVKPGIETAYASQEAALDAVVEFCQAAWLPIPMIVSSGGGIHIYWTLTDDQMPEAWKPVAEGLKALSIAHKLRADHACTSDHARVLRPCGTWNYKNSAAPSAVECVAEAPACNFDDFKSRVDAALKRAGLEAPKEAVRTVESATEGINQAFAIQHNFPPCSGSRVAERCKQLGVIRDTKGNVPEPHWYAGIQLLCHSVEGDALIHEWSNGYAGYSADETQRKITQIRDQHLGPTLCNTFAGRNPGGCDGCPFQGKISSPAQLGHDIPCPPPIGSAVVPEISKETISATDIAVPVPQATAAPTPTLWVLDDLNTQYAWVQRQKQIFRFAHADFIKPEQFRIALANRPPLQLGNSAKLIAPADAWIRWHGRREHLDIVYEPGKPPIHDNKINLWKGWACEAIAGDIGPWNDLLNEAFGAGTVERAYFEWWIAFQIQYPGVKLFTAVLLWSPIQGIGKTLIGETLASLFGENAIVITSDVLSGTYNGWAKGKQFVLGEEIFSQDARGNTDRLKHLITGDTININEKYQPLITLRNSANFMFTSNHSDAVHIDVNDRRYFVVQFHGQKRIDDFYSNIVDWRDNRGGLSALMYHLKHLPLGTFNPKAAPPMTQAKEDMKEATYSSSERWINDSYIDARTTIVSEVVYVRDLVTKYRADTDQVTTDTAMGRALVKVGNCPKRYIMVTGSRKTLYAIRRQQFWAGADNTAWAAEYQRGCAIGSQVADAVRRANVTVPQSCQGLH